MSHAHDTTNSELEKLSETRLTLADSSQDVRDRKVVDRHGEEIGHVSNLFIDQSERKVQMLEVRAGGFFGLGDRHFLLPVGAIMRVTKDEVQVNQTRERVAGSPVYDPHLVVAQTQAAWEPYYGYYGMAPFWGSGFMYPYFSISAKRPDDHDPGKAAMKP
jgi:sporulation protein YlmC with PRC-barrel domain